MKSNDIIFGHSYSNFQMQPYCLHLRTSKIKDIYISIWTYQEMIDIIIAPILLFFISKNEISTTYQFTFLQLIWICHYFIVYFPIVWSVESRGRLAKVFFWARVAGILACFTNGTRKSLLKVIAFELSLATYILQMSMRRSWHWF